MKWINSLQQQRSQIVALVILVFVVSTMTFFSNTMARRLAEDEKDKMEIWAEAYRVLFSEESSSQSNMAMQIISNNETIPLLITDELSNVISHRNIKIPKKNKETFLQNKRLEFLEDNEHPPIKITSVTAGKTYINYIYYGRSNLLKRLAFFPIWQVTIIAFFLVLAYFFFNISKRSEENRVWVGLSKETAHQLGTPISSLLAWLELMRSGHRSDEMVDEMQKDITRLQTVANRFSKIGSKPTLEMYNLNEVLDDCASYMATRISKKVVIVKDYNREQFIPVMMNTELFEWVIENLIKNAVDAMRGGGNITISLIEDDKLVKVDLSDQGKGISKTKFKTVFQPGFSSKKRGWGLGLSFAQRIVKDYHCGKIFVKKSDLNVGTTFRIVLPKCSLEE